MAIIYTYPTVIPTTDDLVLGTDVTTTGKPTKNFTVQSLVDLIAGGVNGLGAVIEANPSALDAAGGAQSATGFNSISGIGSLNFLSLNSTNIVNTAAVTTLNLTATGIISGPEIYGTTFKTSAGSAASWQTTVLSGFTSISTGALAISGAVSGASLITDGDLTGASDTNIASTLAIKTYVDGKIENQDTLAELLAKRPSPLANPSNTTGGTDILVSTNDDITFTDTSKIILGTGSDATIQHDGTDLKITTVKGDTKIQGTLDTTQIIIDGKGDTTVAATAGVELQYATSKKLEVLGTGVTVTGVTTSTGVFRGPDGTLALPSYTFSGDPDTGMFHPAANEIGFSTEGALRLKISNSGVNVTGTIDATGLIEGLSFTTDTTLLKTPMTRFVKSTDGNGATPELFGVAGFPNNTMVPTNLAVKSYVDTKNAFKTLAYEGDTPATITSVATQNNTASTSITIAVLNAGILPGMIIAGTGVTPPGARVITNAGGTTIVVSPAITIPGAGTQDITFAQPFLLNLSNDSLDVAGGTNIGTVAAAVTANVGRLTINLDDNVTLPVGSGKGTYTGTKYTDGIMSIEAGVGSAFKSITTTIDTGDGNTNGFFGPLRASSASTNYAAGVADKAVQLTVTGNIALQDNVVLYPTISTTNNSAVAASATTIVYVTAPTPNLPAAGQVVAGTGVVTNPLTIVQSVSADGKTITVSPAQTGISANATLSYTTPPQTYTSGGNLSIPTFIPDTVATGKLLTGFSTPAAIAGLVNANDNILIGLEKLQTQITALPSGLDYLGTWDARDSISTGLTAAAETAENIVVLTVPNFNVLVGTVITGFVSGGSRTVTAVSADFLSITFGGAAQAWAINLSLTFTAPASASLSRGGNPDLINGTFVAGQYYVVNVAGTATPNGTGTLPNEWKSGDWAIYGDATLGALRWQKLDNTSSIEGSGAANKIARWTGPSTLGTGLIEDNGTNLVTIGNSGGLTVQGNTTLGDSSSDSASSTGTFTANDDFVLKKGFGLDTDYGTTAKALFSGGASAATIPTWTTVAWDLSDGTNTTSIANGGTATFTTGASTAAKRISGTIVTEGSGTVSTSLRYIDELVDPATLGLNFIDAAPTSTTPVGSDFILFSDQENATVKTNVRKALISKLPFNSYLWKLDADSDGSVDVINNEEVDFKGANGITITKAYTDPTHTVTITGVADPVTGTGAAYKLPVWDSGTNIGESMVKQDAASGTTLTISAEDPILILDDTTTNKGSLTISRTADATTYMSSGITLAASKTYGTHVFSQTDGTTPRAILTLDASRNATFEAGLTAVTGALGTLKFISNTITTTSANVYINGTNGDGTTTSFRSFNVADGKGASIFNLTGSNKIAQFNGNVNIADNKILRIGTGNDLELYHNSSSVFSQIKNNTGDLYISNLASDKDIIFQGKDGATAFTALTLDMSEAGNATFNGSVQIDGNLTVDGHIINGGGGSGTHTAKGGTFTNTVDVPLASPIVATEAFTIERTAGGTMVFDVYFTANGVTGQSINTISVAKKFTVVKQYGTTQATISSFKILDTGPGTQGTNTVDFSPTFVIVADNKLKCMITPASNAQKITCCIFLAPSETNATIVLN